MTKKAREILVPVECMAKIFELSGAKFEPDVTADLWPKTMKQKVAPLGKSQPGYGDTDCLHRFYREHGQSAR